MTGNEVCKNCGWRLGQHHAASPRRCPDQERQAFGSTRWLSTNFEDSGISRDFVEEAQNGRYDFGRTTPPPEPEQPIDPSITRDRAHIPQPVVHHQTPHDPFPDLKNWTVTRGERKERWDGEFSETPEKREWIFGPFGPFDLPPGMHIAKVKDVRVLPSGELDVILEPVRPR